MAASFEPTTLQLDKWRGCLQDINFWLDGYLRTDAYNNLEVHIDPFGCVQWNVGVGPTACFTRAISSILQDRKIRQKIRIRPRRPFDYVIEVDMKQAGPLSFRDMLIIKVAEVLGLLDRQEYSKLKEEDEAVRYYSYGTHNATFSLQKLSSPMEILFYQIIAKLLNKRYLLLVQNLHEPIKPISLHALTEGACLPRPSLNRSFWLVTTTSQDVYERSKPDYPCTIASLGAEDLLMLTLYSLHQAAKYILDAINDKEEKYWHIVALKCFHYAIMLLTPYCSYSHSGDRDQQSFDSQVDIFTSDELIRQWAAQGILPIVNQSDQESIGNVILEAFHEYSLLQLPFCSSTKVEDATKTAAHFLIYSGLITEPLTIDMFSDDSSLLQLEHMQWISHVADRGWHVSRDWLSQGAKGPTTLIIRHCSQQSTLFANLDPLLAKLPCICVLDLSYNPLISLPSSVCNLQNLRFLSLRGCNNLSNPFNFPSYERATLPRKNSSNMAVNLLYLDFSYSSVKTFGSDFFHNMPNLQELLLTECSNLVELPSSIAALTSLTKFELTGTQIKSFNVEIFAQMKKLQSLKLINNRNLLLVPKQVSKSSCDLINQHIEGCDSTMDEGLKLEFHPTLRSFSLIGTRHIKRLSLYGCKNLESVDIKELDALEELNLSATGIKELPVDIPNLPRLRRLLLMGVPSLRRFPWHELRRLPDAFYLDQCSDENGNNHYNNKPQAALVCIQDSRFFYSFNDDTLELVRGGKFFKSFYVRVTSHSARCRKIQDEEVAMFNKNIQVSVFAYADVNHRYRTEGVVMVSMDDVPLFREADRHVEMSVVERYPQGLYHLLKVTKSMSMKDDTHVFFLNNLSYLDELEDCLLQRCHRMGHVFENGSHTLRNVNVSRLTRLIYFFFSWSTDVVHFYALRHLRIEHCPRLEGVMQRRSELPSLETLDILFCYNLKAIFKDNRYVDSSSPRYELPRLRRIHLQELPQLQHLHIDDPIVTAPAWEELHVRGCWSLRRLPRLHQQPDKKKAVAVSGERAWWAKLRWDQDSDGNSPILHCRGYKPVLPPTFASFPERIIIKSYLR